MLFGFIGVGAMGGGLARNLIRAGKEVLVFDLSPEAVQRTLEAGSTGKAAAPSSNCRHFRKKISRAKILPTH